ncbi:MAG TPA: MerC domain-containing protein [Sphingomonadaceae bacterium]|nr:MerC domain-containing protein [Sphingomonadaceae bacterium]
MTMEAPPDMPQTAAPRGHWLDRLAIGLSGLCVVHCIGTAVLVTFLASVGGALLNPAIHEIGLALAIVLATLGLGRGIAIHGFVLPSLIGVTGIALMASALVLPHGGGEVICTIIGVSLVAFGHHLNRRALR